VIVVFACSGGGSNKTLPIANRYWNVSEVTDRCSTNVLNHQQWWNRSNQILIW